MNDAEPRREELLQFFVHGPGASQLSRTAQNHFSEFENRVAEPPAWDELISSFGERIRRATSVDLKQSNLWWKHHAAEAALTYVKEHVRKQAEELENCRNQPEEQFEDLDPETRRKRIAARRLDTFLSTLPDRDVLIWQLYMANFRNKDIEVFLANDPSVERPIGVKQIRRVIQGILRAARDFE